MKKLIVLLVLIAVLIHPAFCFADSIDLSDLSDDEIVELLEAVQNEIATRRIEKTATLAPGVYVAGKDIPAATYLLTITNNRNMSTYVSIYKDKDCIDNDDIENEDYLYLLYGYSKGSSYGDGTGVSTYRVELEDGNAIETEETITLTFNNAVQFK